MPQIGTNSVAGFATAASPAPANPFNQDPTFSSDGVSIYEGSVNGTYISTLSPIDPEGVSFDPSVPGHGTLTLVDANGNDITNTSPFKLVYVGGQWQLQVRDSALADYEGAPGGMGRYDVYVRVDDGEGGVIIGELGVRVRDVLNENILVSSTTDRAIGGTGNDTVNLSAYGSAVWVNLAYSGIEVWTRDGPNLSSAQGPYRAIVDLVSIENVVGTNFDDNIGGDAGNNRLVGGLGNDTLIYRGGVDTLDGGQGADLADLSAASQGFQVDLALASADAMAGATLIARLIGIESVIGSAFNDTVLGDSNVNVVTAGGGADTYIYRYGLGVDTFNGGTGNDTVDLSQFGSAVWADLNYVDKEIWTRDAIDLTSSWGRPYRAIIDLDSVENITGSAFADYLAGNAADNLLIGGLGDDTLVYRGGVDTLDGGGGLDTADLSASTVGVRVDVALPVNDILMGPTATTSVRLSGIENVIGTAFDDTVLGDANVNVVTGGGGADSFMYRNGLGVDKFFGGSGTDTVDLSSFGSAVWGDLAYTDKEIWTRDAIDLTSSWGQPYRPIIDLDSVENIRGSAFADSLFGNAGDNLLIGGAGGDTLSGRGGADSFRFYRQDAGIDTVTDFLSGVDRLQVVGYGTYAANAAVSLVTGTGGAAGIFAGGGQGFGYDSVTGAVYFSADGTAAAAVQFATLTAHPTLTATDLHVVANDLI